MLQVILVIHLFLAIALVCVVLLQRSEGGALGVGGGGGMSGFMTGRGTANLLTRATAVLAALFIITSLAMAKLSGGDRAARSILDQPPAAAEQPVERPQAPSAPLDR